MTTATLAITSKTAPRRKKLTRIAAPNVWPIYNDDDYDAAAKVVADLAVYPEGTLSPEDQARLDVFTRLIIAYDEEHFSPLLKKPTALALLRDLAADHGMTESDLGRLLGTRQSGHAILSGERKLSKKHIRILADHFGLSTDAFID